MATAPDSTPHEGRSALAALYRDTMLRDVVPFWLRHGLDREHGGFLTALDRDGSVIDRALPVKARRRTHSSRSSSSRPAAIAMICASRSGSSTICSAFRVLNVRASAVRSVTTATSLLARSAIAGRSAAYASAARSSARLVPPGA